MTRPQKNTIQRRDFENLGGCPSKNLAVSHDDISKNLQRKESIE
jgi:hypothetical protein